MDERLRSETEEIVVTDSVRDFSVSAFTFLPEKIYSASPARPSETDFSDSLLLRLLVSRKEPDLFDVCKRKAIVWVP